MMSIKDLSLDDSQTHILKACTPNDLLKNNRIDDLPDDILVHIFSLLTLKEAGRTSVLSNRWRHVWAYVPSLYFDDSILTVKEGWRKMREIDLKYVHLVDQVVSSHKAHTIDEFNVSCIFYSSRKYTIDNWLRFAIEKRVKRLALNLDYIRQPDVRYNFPSYSSWNQLMSLKLNCVEVSGEFLEKFLCDCQTLESLSVSYSKSLVDSKIVGPPNLKSLEIMVCFNMKHLEISAPNLIYFKYFGPKLLSWPLKSTPKIVEVVIQGSYAIDLMRDSSHLPS